MITNKIEINKLLSNGTYKWKDCVDYILDRTNKKKDSGFKNFLLSREYLGCMPVGARTMYKAYKIWRELNKLDNDYLTIIFAREGKGKSTLAINIAAVVSSSFSTKHICYDLIDLIMLLENKNNYSAGDTIILDEGVLFANSRKTMSKENKEIVDLFSLMRQLNLHVIICATQYKLIDSYLRGRVDFLIRIIKKGSFIAMEKPAIELLNMNIRVYRKPINALSLPNGSFYHCYWIARFPNINDISIVNYLKRKHSSMESHLKQLKEKFKNEIEERRAFQDNYTSVGFGGDGA